MKKNIYLGVVVWGEKHINYFTSYCLRSLLAPKNLQFICENYKLTFLIVTTVKDRDSLENNYSLQLLKKISEVEYREINITSKDKLKVMSEGHLIITNEMFKKRVIGSIVYPDSIYSEAFYEEIIRLYEEKNPKIIVANCPRVANEKILIEIDNKYSKKEYIKISSQSLITIAMLNRHSEFLRYEFYEDIFHVHGSPVVYNTEHNKVRINSMCWAPVLMDYSRIRKHEDKSLRNWTIDGEYVAENFGSEYLESNHVDPKYASIISFTDERDLTYFPLKKNKFHNFTRLSQIYKILGIKNYIYSSSIDQLKRKLFFHTIDWNVNSEIINFKKNINQYDKIIEKLKKEPTYIEKIFYLILKYYDDGVLKRIKNKISKK